MIGIFTQSNSKFILPFLKGVLGDTPFKLLPYNDLIRITSWDQWSEYSFAVIIDPPAGSQFSNRNYGVIYNTDTKLSYMIIESISEAISKAKKDMASISRIITQLETVVSRVQLNGILKINEYYNYVVADSYENLDLFLRTLDSGNVVIDIECDHIQWYQDKSQAYPYVILQLGLYDGLSSVIVPYQALYEQEIPVDYPNATLPYFDDRFELERFSGCRELLQSFFNRKDITFIGHNCKFDAVWLKSIGFDVRFDFDTLLAHYCLNENRGTHGLKILATDYFGLDKYEDELNPYLLETKKLKGQKFYSGIPFDKMSEYCTKDVVITYHLYKLFKEQLKEDGLYELPFKNLLMEANTTLIDTEINGIPIDVDHLDYWKVEVETYLNKLKYKLSLSFESNYIKLTKLEKKKMHDRITNSLMVKDKIYAKSNLILLDQTGDFNANSYYHANMMLYDILKIPMYKNQRSSSAVNIKRIIEKHPRYKNNEFIKALLKFKRVSKIYSSYIKNLLNSVDIDGNIHPTFLLYGTVIGRLSVKNPAAQTIPRPYADILGSIIRSAFIAGGNDMTILYADYSQAEVRGAAILSGDEFLLDVYLNNRDLHTENTIKIFGGNYTKEQRTWLKNLIFALIYGGNEYSFASQANLPLEQAATLVRELQKLITGFTKWTKEVHEQAKTQGYVQSLYGRKKRYPVITREGIRELEKTSVHMLVSSLASDITLSSANAFHNSGMTPMLLVHDSVLIPILKKSDLTEYKEYAEHVMMASGKDIAPGMVWNVDIDIRKRWSPKPVIFESKEIQNSVMVNLEITSLPATIHKSKGQTDQLIAKHFVNEDVIQLWPYDVLEV